MGCGFGGDYRRDDFEGAVLVGDVRGKFYERFLEAI